ncbi:MAG: FAD-dependent oxidoreductase, partial [Dehalococcoidia bacterium]
MVSQRYPHLFSSITIGNMTVRNRIVSTAHATVFAQDGRPGPALNAYQAEKAKGGCGLVICYGSASVHPSSPGKDWGGVEIHDDSIIPYFQKAAEAVHQYGAKIISQISHRGRRGTTDLYWQALLAPSPIPERSHRETPHQMEIEDILMIVEAYGQAARRVKEGGFDGVEILMGGGHLPEQFFSPFSNRRDDEYGGSLENRMRFAFQVLDSVRAKVGQDFVVGIRLTGDELIEGVISKNSLKWPTIWKWVNLMGEEFIEKALGLDVYVEIAKRLATTGKIDYINVVGGTTEYLGGQSAAVPPSFFAPGSFVYQSVAIKEVVDIPVIAVGRILDPLQAERILAEGQADLVAMTRALIADPEMPKKAMEGRLDDIRPCVGNNQGCVGRLFGGKPITCIHNPVIGREEELAVIEPAAQKKRVVVVGGGPAGLEAARVAAIRGHEVVLFEKGRELGGQIRTMANAPGREEYISISDWLINQVKKLGVDIRLGVEATPQAVKQEKPDAVVVAAGSTPLPPSVSDIENIQLTYPEDVLMERVTVGDKVLIIDEDNHHKGPATAEFLTERGKEVEIVSSMFTIGEDIDLSTKPVVY